MEITGGPDPLYDPQLENRPLRPHHFNVRFFVFFMAVVVLVGIALAEIASDLHLISEVFGYAFSILFALLGVIFSLYALLFRRERRGE